MLQRNQKYLLLGLIASSFISASTLSFAGNSPISCHIKAQDGESDWSFCTDSKKGSIRCYADIYWTNHPEEIYRIWGDQCWSSYGDCWWSGKGHVTGPCHE